MLLGQLFQKKGGIQGRQKDKNRHDPGFKKCVAKKLNNAGDGMNDVNFES